MGKRTNLWGFSWSRGSSICPGLVVVAIAFCASILDSLCFASIWASRAARSASKVLFSLLVAEKSSFFTGDSIEKFSIAVAACCNRVLVWGKHLSTRFTGGDAGLTDLLGGSSLKSHCVGNCVWWLYDAARVTKMTLRKTA